MTLRKPQKKTKSTSNQARSKSVDLKILQRAWVIPDIHACYQTLSSLIQSLSLNPSQDILIFLGDYINKGPFPIETLNFLEDLKKSHKTIFLLGNHDSMLLDYWKTHDPELEERLIALGSKDLLHHRETYTTFFSETVHVVETSQQLIVHAGFDFDLADPFMDIQSMLTIRELKYDPVKAKNKQIIRGHYPFPIEEIRKTIAEEGKVLSLDNGCVYADRAGQGNLLAFDLKSKELLVQKNMDQT